MTTIELDNINHTNFNFSYDNNLSYKKSIRPALEYGDWKKKPEKTLLKVTLNIHEYSLFTNPLAIKGLGTYIVDKEIWIDLEDIYLVIPYDKKIERRIKNNNVIIAFYYIDQLISVIGK